MKIEHIEYVVIHCSDSDVPAHDDISVIEAWHRARKFNKVGYHWYIKKDGTIQVGRIFPEAGAHTKAYNDISLAICLGGRWEFTVAQKKSLEKLLWEINTSLSSHFAAFADMAYVVPHSYLTRQKPCPNFHWDRELFSVGNNRGVMRHLQFIGWDRPLL